VNSEGTEKSNRFLRYVAKGMQRGLSDDNHITETWTWRENDKDTPMVFHFTRKKN